MKPKMKGGDQKSNVKNFFIFIFLLIVFIFAIIALYSTNSEIIGFLIFFAAQLLMAFSIIKEYKFGADSKASFEYEIPTTDYDKNRIHYLDLVEKFPFLRIFFNVRIAVVFELIMVSISLLFIIITYRNINAHNTKFGISTIKNLSKTTTNEIDASDYTSNVIITEKENFKVIIIVLTIIVFIIVSLNGNYELLKTTINGFFSTKTNIASVPNSSLYYGILFIYFIGSVIFLFFGYLPLDSVINNDNKLLDNKDQMAIKVLSVFNMFVLLIFILVAYNLYLSQLTGTYSTNIFGETVNSLYLVLVIGIYYLSGWAIYISNNMRNHFLPSKMVDPNPSNADAPIVQFCDPNKPETCPHPGSLPLSWLYSYGM